MPLSDIVNVQISRDYLAVSRAGFGTLLIVGDSERQSARVAEYSTLSGMVDAGFFVTDPEYLMAQGLLSQNPTVTSFLVGEKRSGDADYPEAIAAIIDENNNWYGLVCETHVKSEQLAIAAYIESLGYRKLYMLSSSDSDIIDTTFASDTSTIAYELQNAGYLRSALIYSGQADTKFPESSMAGTFFPSVPGSYTVMFKKMIGINPDVLTDTQGANALAKNCNTYETIGGVPIIREGRVSGGAERSGEYIDIIVGIDWTHARVTENVFAYLASQKKVPFTDDGITGVQSKIEEVLKTGIDNGLYSPFAFDEDDIQTGGYVVNVPKASDVSSADKAARSLTGVTFTAWLAGAIHAVTINGVVTL